MKIATVWLRSYHHLKSGMFLIHAVKIIVTDVSIQCSSGILNSGPQGIQMNHLFVPYVWKLETDLNLWYVACRVNIWLQACYCCERSSADKYKNLLPGSINPAHFTSKFFWNKVTDFYQTQCFTSCLWD